MASNNLSFSLHVLITKQGKRFVAYTPALDISTSGKTKKEAQARFVELSNLFLEEIINAGTTTIILSELGWTKGQKKWTSPKVISTRTVDLKIPALV